MSFMNIAIERPIMLHMNWIKFSPPNLWSESAPNKFIPLLVTDATIVMNE